MRLLIIFCLLFCRIGLAADPVPEYAMKATYLYNFAIFTEWPTSSSDTFNLCILGQDNFGPALNGIEGKKVHGSRLAIARLSSLHNLKSCQILFIGEQEAANMRKILDMLGDAPVLTVTDAAAQTASGAIIRLSLDGQRLAFDINAEAAHRSQLHISSKLLQLAKNLR